MSGAGNSPEGSFSDLGSTRMQRVNQVCNRFESAWRSGNRPDLAEHLTSAPAQEQPVLARMLIELDVDYRRMHGENPRPDDYRSLLSFEAAWLDTLVRGASDATRIDSPAAQETSGEFSLQTPVSAKPSDQLPRVLGDYLLLERIGGGGMGVVYKAEHRHMRRIVALKLIRPEHAAAALAQQRFQREVEAAARLHHPYIVTAYDARIEQGTWCLISEFVAGQDLSRVVQESGPLELSQAMQCVCQTAEALEYAHQQGVVHRDVKPSNLLLDSSGNVKVLDMGLARLQTLETDTDATLAAARLTQTGYVIGTIDFMAPEQAKNSAEADARSDIYSLGCTLYYLLTGEAAYRGTTVMETLLAHREQPIPLLSSVRSDVPPQLEQILQRMLAKQPQARYQSMSEVLEALKSVTNASLASLPGALKRSPSIEQTANTLGVVEPLHAKELPASRPTAVRSRVGSPWVWSAIGGLSLIGLLWIGSQLWNSNGTSPVPDNASAVDDLMVRAALVNSLPTLSADEAAAAQTSAAEQLGIPVEIENDLGMRLRLVPAYRLAVGDQMLALLEPVYLGVTEVTVGQFRQFVEATEYQTEAEQVAGWGMRDGRWELTPGYAWNNLGHHPLQEDLPVVNISWNDAQAFCTWFTSLPQAGGTYRLPTEREWELACRAGSNATWFFGEDRNRLGEHAWYEDNAGSRLQRVAQKSPNPFGFHDMLGNESEWCSDLFTPEGIDRTQRGGSFSHRAEQVTSAARWSEAPQSSSHGAFRVVREVTNKE